jgi:DNA repair protein RadC
MAAVQLNRTFNRHDSTHTILDAGPHLKKVLGATISSLATSNSHHSHSQPIRTTSDPICLRDGSNHLVLPTVCNDFLGNNAGSAQCDAQLLKTALGENLPTEVLAELLKRCGDITQLLLMDFAELVRLTGSEIDAEKLGAIRAIAMRFISTETLDFPILGDTHTIVQYLQADMGNRRVETFRALFLDCHNQLITNDIMWSGTASEVQVYPREIMRRALEVDACAIIVAHNHPSQIVKPSAADINVTKTLLQSAAVFGIYLHDHLIISKQSHHSMRIQKTIDPWE